METTIPLHGAVICDFCNEDYTTSDAVGDVQFGSYAACPNCSDRIIQSAKNYHEEEYLTYPNEGETFHDFVIRLRGGADEIIIYA